MSDPVCSRCSQPIRPGPGVMVAGGETVHVQCVARALATELHVEASDLRRQSAALSDQARSLRSPAAWLAAIVESSDDAIVGKRVDGTIVFWNAAAERLYGYSTEDAIGRPLSILVPPDQPNEISLLLERVQGGERIRNHETQRVRKDGTRVEVSLTISPVRDETGLIVGAAAIVQDLTERRRLADARLVRLAHEEAARAEAVRSEAEETNRLKDEFLAMLSHELRSPLNAIGGWLNILQGATGDVVLAGRAVETIERNTRLLTKVVDDLLDVSQVVAGRLKIERQRVDVVVLVQEVLETMRPAAVAKGLALRPVLELGSAVLWGDSARLHQAIGNLVANAIKFTPAGGMVEVRVQGDASRLQITVSDTGQGISPQFLPYVFERFRQEDTSMTRPHGGLGLGLAIVRRVVELHEGTVDAESPGEGRGARFTVRLPLLKDRG